MVSGLIIISRARMKLCYLSRDITLNIASASTIINY